MKSNTCARLASLLLGPLLCIGLLAASVTEEVALGNLHGTLRMKENGKTLKGAWITLIYRGGGNEETNKDRYFEGDADGTFEANRITDERVKTTEQAPPRA